MRPDISDEAERDLDEIYRYGRKMYGEQAARAYLTSILASIDFIGEWPLAAPIRDDVRPSVRLRVHEAHNIFYDVGNDKIQIVRILHRAADWMNIL